MNEHRRQSTGWQLERSGPEAYEQYLVPGIFEPWAERLLEQVDVRNGDRFLDVACGTGIVARRAAVRLDEEGEAAGLDINEAMLAEAEAAAGEVTPTIEWHLGDATDLPFPDERFDVVSCQQALQFIEDPVVALEEMQRVLAPGGRLAVSVWRPLEYQPGYVVLADALERHVGDDAGRMMRSPFPDWDGDHLRSLVRDLEFSERSIGIEIGSVRYPSAEEFVRREAASSPLAEPLAALDEGVQDDIVRDLEDTLQSYIDDGGLVFPMESYVITLYR